MATYGMTEKAVLDKTLDWWLVMLGAIARHRKWEHREQYMIAIAPSMGEDYRRELFASYSDEDDPIVDTANNEKQMDRLMRMGIIQPVPRAGPSEPTSVDGNDRGE